VSFRLRLALLFAGTIAVLVVATCAATYLVVRSNLRSDARGDAARLARSAASVDDPEELSLDRIAGPDARVWLTDGSGAVIASSHAAGQREHTLADIQRAVASAPSGSTAATVPRHEGGYAVVLLGNGAIESSLSTLLSTLLVVGLAVVLASAALGALLAGRALRPVERMRARAAALGAPPGGERLPVPPGDDELARLGRTLNELLGRLDGAVQRERALVADVSHELRTPLAVISGELELALSGGTRAEAEASVRVAAEEAARLARIAEDLLLLARADSGPPSTPEPLPVQPLLAALSERYDAVRVPVHAEDVAPVAVAAAPGDLDRVLANLVDNAVRHATSRVSVGATGEGPWTLLTVTDDGPGIAAQDRDRVFERFARLDDARDRDAGGTGLGLSIVRQLVGKAGGSVRLRDAGGASDGPGLRVEVRLPKAQLGPRPAQVQA